LKIWPFGIRLICSKRTAAQISSSVSAISRSSSISSDVSHRDDAHEFAVFTSTGIDALFVAHQTDRFENKVVEFDRKRLQVIASAALESAFSRLPPNARRCRGRYDADQLTVLNNRDNTNPVALNDRDVPKNVCRGGFDVFVMMSRHRIAGHC
jgi:hypothetical protein